MPLGVMFSGKDMVYDAELVYSDNPLTEYNEYFYTADSAIYLNSIDLGFTDGSSVIGHFITNNDTYPLVLVT